MASIALLAHRTASVPSQMRIEPRPRRPFPDSKDSKTLPSRGSIHKNDQPNQSSKNKRIPQVYRNPGQKLKLGANFPKEKLESTLTQNEKIPLA